MTGQDWAERAAGLTHRIDNLIDGRRKAPGGERRITKLAPRDGRPLAEFAASSAADVEEAVAGARAALADGRWADLPLAERKAVLVRLAELIEANAEELGLLECIDTGKPIGGAVAFDVAYAASLVRYSAEAIDKLHGKVFASDRSSLSYELLRPCGVVAGIVGWNFPLVLAASKIGPALAAGNSIVLKPSEITSLSAIRLGELALEAGVPPNVLNIVHGAGETGAGLARHMDVDLLTFTGSSATGRQLMVAAGQSNMKRLILECGGKAANIVFEDCPDLEAASASVIERAFWNQGQVCTASSRLIVHASLRDELIAAIIAKLDALLPGDPFDPATGFGALVSAEHHAKVERYVGKGLEEGGELLFQLPVTDPVEGGYYAAPTLVGCRSSGCTIAQEEIFGPVLAVMEFRDEAEAIRLANDTIYGLSAIVWTRDIGRAQRMAYALDTGWTTINGTANPKGGAGPGVLSVGGHKQSGFGTEGGLDGLAHYLKPSAIQIFG